MYLEDLQKLGLVQNEARIYETLVRQGELPVGKIASHSGVNRRNAYDSLNRLVEKGLAFEVVAKGENHYQAADPRKLSDMVKEKQAALDKILPSLEALYVGTPAKNSLAVYRGLEGWKSYLRDAIRVGEDVYALGVKGAWEMPGLESVVRQFKEEMARKGMRAHVLYDHELRGDSFVGHAGDHYRFLPAEYSSSCAIDCFGDYTVIFSGVEIGRFTEDSTLTVIANREIAHAFRKWFQAFWAVSAEK